MWAVGTASRRLGIHYFECGPLMDSRPCPGVVMSVDVYQRARSGYVRPHHAAPRPVQALGETSDEGPVSGAHVVREPDCISELILQGSDRPVDLNVFGVAVFTPGVVSVDIPASSQRCAQAFQKLRVVGFITLAQGCIGNLDAGWRQLRLRLIGLPSSPAFGNFQVDDAAQRQRCNGLSPPLASFRLVKSRTASSPH